MTCSSLLKHLMRKSYKRLRRAQRYSATDAHAAASTAAALPRKIDKDADYVPRYIRVAHYVSLESCGLTLPSSGTPANIEAQHLRPSAPDYAPGSGAGSSHFELYEARSLLVEEVDEALSVVPQTVEDEKDHVSFSRRLYALFNSAVTSGPALPDQAEAFQPAKLQQPEQRSAQVYATGVDILITATQHVAAQSRAQQTTEIEIEQQYVESTCTDDRDSHANVPCQLQPHEPSVNEQDGINTIDTAP